MSAKVDFSAAMAAAVTVIDNIASAVEAATDDIDAVQIRELRAAIDRLEAVLNDKKRAIEAAVGN